MNTEVLLQTLNACFESILITDSFGRILYTNEPARQNPLFQSQNVDDPQIWDFFSIQQNNRLKMIMNQIVISRQPQLIKYKDGDHWFETKISTFSTEDIKADYLFFSTVDITRQTLAEEQLKISLLELATAQEDERHRISRDLHDEVGQRLTALLLQIRSLKEFVSKDQKIDVEEINNVSRNLEQIIKNLRQIFFQLYPPSLTKVSLPKVLEALCTSVEDVNGIRIDLSAQEDIPELVENQVITIYRFVQEGLTNVIKHAKANSVWVNLDYSNGDINVSVEDDGIGFDSEAITEGVGIRGIRERFVILNGSFEIESALEKGTRLSGSIPIRKKMKKEKK